MERTKMRNKALGIMAAATLLVSVGMADAKDPVTLTDDQLDKVTAGASAIPTEASLVAVSTAELNRLLAISTFTVDLLNGNFLTPLPVAP
jgi:hypothetical protein